MNVVLESLEDYSNSTQVCHGNGQETWILSIIASCAVGLSGVLPLALIPVEVGQKFNPNSGDCKLLRLLLSFAVGGLLGDVFLHLLPEAWNSTYKKDPLSQLYMGGWILTGIVTFIVVEMMFAVSNKSSCETTEENNENCQNNNSQRISNGLPKSLNAPNDNCKENESSNNWSEMNCPIHISGYLNLVANAIDNFSHGLAVAASFIVSTKMGLLTTVAILIHEIPHEVGDFAILLKSGFNRWAAAKAQLSTALIGVMGAIVALSANSLEDVGKKTSWILPFTAGGFLNIALVNILPDIMKENDPKESLKQIMFICCGIAIMAFVGIVAE